MSSINERVLAEIMHKTPTAEAFIRYAAARGRDIRGGVSKIRTLRAQMGKKGLKAVPEDLIEMFKDLERLNYGKLQGNDKFKWHEPIAKIGELVKKTPEGKEEREARKAFEPVVRDSPSRRTVVFHLYSGGDVTLTINGKVTKADLSFISDKLLQEID